MLKSILSVSHSQLSSQLLRISLPSHFRLFANILFSYRFFPLRLYSELAVMSRRRGDLKPEQSEQAIESHEHVNSDSGRALSEQSGQDLIEDAERDYEKIDQLDRYENEGVDAEEIDLNPEARRKAEKELDRRERQFGEVNQVEDFFEEQDDDQAELRRRRKYYEQGEDQEQVDERRYIDAEQCKGKLGEWINEDDTKRYIRRRFGRFLTEYVPKVNGERTAKDKPIYNLRIQDMLHLNLTSIEIKYEHFKEALPTMAIWLGLEPSHLLPELNASLYAVLCKASHQYKGIIKEAYVKFVDLPIIDRIPDLRVEHVTKLIRVRGVVTVRSEVFSQLKKVVLRCYRCGELKGPFFLTERETVQQGACRSCQSLGPFITERQKSIYRNFQKLIMQESPGEVLPGRIPRSKEVIVTGDCVDLVKPGEQIEVIGVYLVRHQVNLNTSQGFPVFHTFIEANSMRRINDVTSFTAIDEKKFLELAKRPDVGELIANSIAPSIYGHFEVKQALAWSLFGGNEKFDEAKAHRIRGDINVLLLGDPGTAKSQCLKSLQKVAPRSVYATGKGASAVGLTATVRQDSMTGEWRLQAGAMVLADRGLCLIDEFDKINEHDRTSIHEAMEQQTISISKAGIVAQLRARCSVVAAANPIQGRYNETINFADNVNLSQPILSRFDLVKVIKDRPNEELDHDMATFVINSHMENHPNLAAYEQSIHPLTGKQKPFEIIDKDFLKQYIVFGRERVKRAAISDKCREMIMEFYVKLRNVSANAGGLTITPRHLESTIRICEANAKMHLRQETYKQDAEAAIRAMLRSFVETQKHATAKKIERDLRLYQ